MKRDLIVFGEDWASLPSSTQHLIKHISKNRKVLWINSIGLRKPSFNAKDVRRAFSKITCSVLSKAKLIKRPKHANIINTQSDSISTHTLFSLPAPKYRWERWIVKKILAKQIKSLLKKNPLVAPAIWTSLPTASDLVDEFPQMPYIYYCGDDFSGLAGVDHDTAMLHEEIIVQNSRLIMASSKELMEKFPKEKSYFLPHGVDLDLFIKQSPRAYDLPSSQKPIAGFYGSISTWLDLDLLKEVILKLPHWNFVFIGERQVDARALEKLDNVFFLGPKAHRELPRYSQHWQVSLLPFVDNAQIRACNPLKLKEYLAAGSPIISTQFPAVEAYKNSIRIIENAREMIQEIENYSGKRSATETHEQQSSVLNEAWSSKATQVEKWIDAL